MILLGTKTAAGLRVLYTMSRGNYGNASRIVWSNRGWLIHDSDYGETIYGFATSPAYVDKVWVKEPECDKYHEAEYCLAIVPDLTVGEHEWLVPVIEMQTSF